MEKNHYGIDKNIHYFCLMEPVQSFLGIGFTCSCDGFNWYECEIDESRYKVDENYKITLRNINGPEYEHYYQSDFMQLIKGGQVIPKTSENMHVKTVDFWESIPGSIAMLHHQGQVIIEG
jgi:hypothetical protein